MWDFPFLPYLLCSHRGGMLHELPGDRCKAAQALDISWGGSGEVRRYRESGQIIRIPNFMTCLTPCGQCCHSPVPLSLVPATPVPGLPRLRTSKNHVWKVNIPILGYEGIWKEPVVALTTAAWTPTNLPSPFPPSYYGSYYTNSILWKLVIKGQE